MSRAASLLLYCLLIIPLLLSACAGTPSGGTGQASSDQDSRTESGGIPAAADPDYDPAVNFLVHQGWSVSMPPGWRAGVDHSAGEGYLFRLSHDLVRMSVQPLVFSFDVDWFRLTEYMEERLRRVGKVARHEEIEALSFSRDGRRAVWDIERDAGGLHRVVLEENAQGLFEWRMTISKKRQDLYEDAVMRIFREAEILENREVSVRVQDSGFEFSSQGGLWRWYGDMDQGFLLESLVSGREPHTFLSVVNYESLKKARLNTEEWLEAKKRKSNEVLTMDFFLSGRPYRSRFWIQDENRRMKEVLFFAEKEEPVMFYLDMRNREDMDYDVNLFLEGDSFKNLLDYSIKLPEGEV